ncbi:MAG: hypothetical protein IKF80_04215 [Erysipelotrichaceae bacterium]|nr:hypothetical protein [Erysipelotrichaceae bacterium]
MSELTADLDEKIRGLDLAVSSVDQSVNEKAMLIRNKAVGILNNVKEKSVDLSEAIADENELNSAVETIRKKADSLYSEAIQKIDDLQAEAAYAKEVEDSIKAKETLTVSDDEGLVDMTDIEDARDATDMDESETKDDIEGLIDDGKIEYQQFERQEASAEKEKTEVERSEVTKKALEVLDDWLRPKEVRK